MAYKNSQEVYDNLLKGETTINSVNRQMLRYFNKKDIDKWLMFAEAKTLYLMEIDEDDKEVARKDRGGV